MVGGLARALQVTLRLQVQGTDQIGQCCQAKETSSQKPGSTGGGGERGAVALLMEEALNMQNTQQHSHLVTVTRPAPPLEGLSCGQAAVC